MSLKIFIICTFFVVTGCVYHDLEMDGEAPTEEGFECTTEVSWEYDILPIMQQSCATVTCHDGITRLDWRDYQKVNQYAAAIKRRTQDRSMPFDGTISKEAIDKIACWVDNGALQN